MPPVFRAATPDDLPRLSELLQKCFGLGPGAPFVQPDLMRWKYWEPRGDWNEPRSYVLEKDGTFLAHAGLWPVVIESPAGIVRGVHMIDWGSDKASPGAGLAIVQKLARMFDFIYAIGGSDDTQKALPAFGFRECARTWKAAIPLRPLRQVLTHQHRNWKLAPRLARNYILSLAGRRQPGKGWTASRIAPEQISADAAAPQVNPRPPAFFEYLARCPAAKFFFYAIRETDRPRGHFAVSLVRGQARLAGVWLTRPDADAWGQAFVLATRAAQDLAGANEFVAEGTPGPAAQGAARAGLRVIDGPPVYLLNKAGRLVLPEGFQFQLSDDDEAFLDTGSSTYWT